MRSALARIAYLSRQLRTILPLIVVLTFVMFFSVYVVPPTEAAMKEFGDNAQLYHLDRARDCLHHGRLLLVDGRSVGHAHGDSGQCARRFGLTPRLQ